MFQLNEMYSTRFSSPSSSTIAIVLATISFSRSGVGCFLISKISCVDGSLFPASRYSRSVGTFSPLPSSVLRTLSKVDSWMTRSFTTGCFEPCTTTIESSAVKLMSNSLP